MPAGRAVTALALLAALGAGVTWLRWQPHDVPPELMPSRAVSHEVSAANQTAYPTSFASALREADFELSFDQGRAAPGSGWLMQAMVGNSYMKRARLTGSFDDYALAGAAYDRAFAVADPGFGPHLERASYSLTVHRLDGVEPDLARIDRYAVPVDAATRSAITGMRGDLLFYRGRYSEALALYEQSRMLAKGMSSSFRLANYWAKMGNPDLALRYIGEAESGVDHYQQQILSFLETQRGIIEMNRGRWEKGARHFVRANMIFPGDWRIEEQIGRALALNGDTARAMAVYQRIAARTNSPEAMADIASLYRATGDHSNADAWAKRAGRLWEGRVARLPEAAYGHALKHYLAFGDPAEALAMARRNHAARPYAESAIILASALIANRRPAEALRAIEPVLLSGWVSADQHIVAAQAYALLGRGGEADAERRKALAINPRILDDNAGVSWTE